MTEKEKQLREDICQIARMMYDKDLISGPAGNISARLDENTFLLTPSMPFKQFMTPDQLITVNLDGEKCGTETEANKNLKPTSEVPMHLEAYKIRPDIQGIVHAHPAYVVALTSAGKKFRSEVQTEAMLFLGSVAEADYATPTTAALGTTVAAKVKDHNCIILPHHGAFVAGKTVWDAFSNLEVLEFAAKVNYLVYSMGGDKPIAPEHKKEILGIREKMGMALPSDKNLL
jgi:L-fuculose-phosphate aldolase